MIALIGIALLATTIRTPSPFSGMGKGQWMGEFRSEPPSPQRGEGSGVRGEALSRTELSTAHPNPQTQLTEKQIAIRDTIHGRSGQNGYEEFLDASVIAVSPKLEKLYAHASVMGRLGKQPEDLEPPPGLPKDYTPLDLYRAIAREAEPLFTLIERGSRKPVRFPLPRRFQAQWPQNSALLWAGEMVGFMAVVDFADGKGSSGASKLLLGIKFARQMQTGGTGHAFYGYALESRLLAIVEKNLFAHPVHFLEGVNQLPDNLPMLRQAFEGEATIYRSAFLAYTRDPRVFGEEPSPSLKLASSQLTQARAAQIYDAHLSGLEDLVKWSGKRLDEPESTWLELPKRQFQPPTLPEGAQSSAEKELTDSYLAQSAYLAEFLIRPEAPFNSLFRFLAIQRIQQRILKHTASVAAYKWEHGVLPTTLAKVYGKEPLDPINGQPYRLTLVGDTIKITLEVDGIGPIGLTGQWPSMSEVNPETLTLVR